MSPTQQKPILYIAASALLALSAAALSAAEAGEDIPITDPALLEKLGFEEDATHVYATPRAYKELLMNPAERAALQQTRAADLMAGEESAGPFGTSAVGFTPVLAHAIRPRESATEHSLFFGRERQCLDGPPTFDAYFDALPHGARLLGVNVWYFDNDTAGDLEVTLWRICQPDSGPGNQESTLLGTFESNGTGGNGHGAFSVGEDIDLQSCGYYARIALGTSPCSGGDALTIQKVRARWRRQVSPAPGAATFDDVPPDHLFFQQIEALAASEITGGCGGSNFCPDAPLTRGQMAAFLATALGLHWGTF